MNGKKILKNKKYKRILEISEDSLMVTTLDSRFYRRNGKYYPSITHVLSAFPKGPHYEDWLMKYGFNSKVLAAKAADEGTQVHELVERYLNGEEIKFLNEREQPIYDPEIWKMFLNFVDFWETYKPTLIEAEVHLFSDKLKIAGTCDIVCEIDGEIWILDLKTSNQITQTYEIQTSLYKECYEECFQKKVAKTGVLWVKAGSRGPDKIGKKIKGRGWELVEASRKHSVNIEIYKALRTIFDVVNPKNEPNHLSFPTVVSRKE
jgi:hypothetical protein